MALEDLIYSHGIWIMICILIFILSYVVQLFFYAVYFRRAYLKKSNIYSKTSPVSNPLSVIICARNEAENLKKNLPLILEQDYKNFEVIVVNDRSTDETDEVLANFKMQYPNLIITGITKDPKFTSGKKLALLIGIKASSNEWLLLTDADCRPSGSHWLSQVQKNFNEKTEIVIGYGGYRKERGFINLLVRFETAFNAMSFFGMARAGKPYMAVGRNLAYRKSLFFKNNGFASHTGLMSGDDDLFINETANADNTVIEMHPDSFTWSQSEKNLKAWIRQKKRHLTTGWRYKTGSKFRLILENMSRVTLIVSFIILSVRSLFAEYFLAAFLLIYLFKIIIIKIVFTRLEERYLFIPSILLEPLIPLIYGLLHISNYFEKSQSKWK